MNEDNDNVKKDAGNQTGSIDIGGQAKKVAHWRGILERDAAAQSSASREETMAKIWRHVAAQHGEWRRAPQAISIF